VVAQQQLCAFTDRFEIAKRGIIPHHIGIDHAQPQTVFITCVAGNPVVQFPVSSPALKRPPHPGQVSFIFPIWPVRQCQPCIPVELALAVGAVAYGLSSQSRPAVIGKTIRMVKLEYFLEDLWDIFLVIRAVDTSQVAPLGDEMLTFGINGKPIWMLVEETLGCPVRVHARQHCQPFLACSINDLTEKVTVAQVLGAVLVLKMAGIVSDDAPSIDNHALDTGFSPIVTPKCKIIIQRVDLSQVGLPPAQGAGIPRLSAFSIIVLL
jgi:hypothetical protein